MPDLDTLIDAVIRTGKPKPFAALDAAAREAPLPALIAASRALLARDTWPADIVAMEGQERNLFVQRRGSALGRTLASALRERQDPAADDALVALIEEADETTRGFAQGVAIGSEGPPASARVLERIATHLAAGDPLLPAAAVARYQLGARDIGERLAAIDDGGQAFVGELVTFVRLAYGVVTLDVALWDFLHRRLGAHAAVLLSNELEERAPPGLLLHVLASADARDCDDAVLVGLRLRADRSAVSALREILPRVADRPIAKQLEKLVAALDGKQPRKRVPALPKLAASVATDGGPILLATKQALASWQGALPDMPPHGDYTEACAIRDVGTLERAGLALVVLPSHAVDVMHPGDGSVWLLVAGTLEAVWAARDALDFEPLEPSLDASSGPLVLLDAAFTPARARSEPERSAAIRTKKTRYALERATGEGGQLEVVRLVPR